jgi:hypothetical protein
MRAALLFLAISLTACSGDDSSDPSSSSAPCVVGKLTLIGELEGQAVSVEVDWTGRSWNQLSEPKTLDVSYGGGMVHMEWNELVAVGSTTDATGNIVMPPGAPRAGETVCGGAGSSITDRDDQFAFGLRDLSLGPTCPGSPLAGSLDGCAGDRPPP